MPELVEVSQLSFRYQDSRRWILKDLNLNVKSEEILLLAGSSGCGKSTLLRSINGLIPHMYSGEYKGAVTVAGSLVKDTQMNVLAQKVGLLFQNPENQIFMFSVERDIAFGLENLGVPEPEIRKRVDDAMMLLGISQLAKRAPHELSDGQKQRVALAGVIAMQPKLIILDEPTSLLDPKTASELVALVDRLRRETGITFVVVEHRLDLLTKIADRIAVMSEGSIVLDGSPSAVLSDERVQGYGINVPAITKLQQSLKRDGLQLSSRILSPKELAEELNLNA
ncbi:MAG: ATP-binding cassette domain-containing protein [Thaumarchaeota archaeon]|nr:ATP-binding cassette domain-containing protein [Nitrososphaerota archaeon]